MSTLKNKLKRAAAMAAAGAKRATAATAAGAKRAAAAARAKYDKMQEGKKAPATAPTPYVNQNGNRIYKSNKGAVFTKNAEGNRNYAPVAVGIKEPNGKAMPLKVINKKTVPLNIRPSNNNKNLDKTEMLMEKNMMLMETNNNIMKRKMMFNKDKELMKKNMMLMNKNNELMKKNL